LKHMVRAMAAQASRADALEREIETLKARNADADERIKRLMQILKAYDRARFGRRSEKLGSATAGDEDAQQAFLFEEIETGISALRAQVGKGQASQQKRVPRPRKGFPPHLERIEVVIEPDDLPEHVGKQKMLIGEDMAERLDVIPAKFRVIITRRPKYAFKGWDGVIQALAPNHIIESGLPSKSPIQNGMSGFSLLQEAASCAGYGRSGPRLRHFRWIFPNPLPIGGNGRAMRKSVPRPIYEVAPRSPWRYRTA